MSRHEKPRYFGELDADGEPGVGTTFSFTIPLSPAAAPVSLIAANEAQMDASAERPIRVLVADDHPTNRQVVELILDEIGAELVCVEDGQQAVEAFRRSGFDIVLMDLTMPVMDGLEATRRIREFERQAGLERTPVIMLTASVLPEHIDASLAAGADHHVSKPISARALLAAVMEICGAGGEAEIPPEPDCSIPRHQVAAGGAKR